VDLERFVARHLKSGLDQYAPLEDEILGATEFFIGRAPKIQINRSLTAAALDDPSPGAGALGRWRATIAHEGAHVLLHRVLFELDDNQTTLFGVDRQTNGPMLLRCLKREVSFDRRSSDWREYQANRGMAALLMPRELFPGLAAEEAAAVDLHLASIEAATEAARLLAARLASRTGVSRQAASIRLSTLGLIRPVGQLPVHQ